MCELSKRANWRSITKLNVLMAALRERFIYKFPEKTAFISCINHGDNYTAKVVPVENQKARGYSTTSKWTCWRKEDMPVQHYWTPVVGSHCCKLLWQVRQECSHIICHSSQVVCSSLPHNHDDVLPSVFREASCSCMVQEHPTYSDTVTSKNRKNSNVRVQIF